MTAKKDASISYVRLMAMMMIIICHFFQFYGNELAFWFNVGVQIFLIVSGFLYGSKEIEDPVNFIVKQFKKILIPYWVFLLIMSVLYILFARDRFSVGAFIHAILGVGTVDGLGHLWFIGYILFCYLITPYLYWVRKKTETYSFIKSAAVYALILAAIVVLGTLIDFYFIPARICCYLVGFFVSFYYKKYGKRILVIFAAVFGGGAVIANAVRIYIKYMYVLNPSSLAKKIFSFSEPYMHLLLGLALFLIAYLLFSKAKPLAIVRFSDRFSFHIYIVHLVFILSPFSTMAVTPIAPVNWLITLVAIVCCGVLLYYLSRPFSTIASKKDRR